MSQRALIWLGAGLAVLVLLAVLGQRQTAPTAPATQAVFLPGLMSTLDKVDSISIVGAGNASIATLERSTDGWTVRERDGYRADLTKVRHTLLSLAEANIVEAKTANPEMYAMLGVEDVADADATGLGLTLGGLDPPVTVIVGEAAGDYRRYVRRGGEAQSYLINRDPELGETAAAWLDTTIIDLPSARVQAVTVTHPDGEIVHVSKASSGQQNFTVADIPEGRSLLYDSVANVMAGVLQNLTLDDVGRSTGMDETAIVTEYVTFDGLILTIRGEKLDDGSWISITASSGPRPVETDPAAAPAEDQEPTDPAAEAADINARLEGWRYRIPAYKFDQMTRSMNDLLQAQN